MSVALARSVTDFAGLAALRAKARKDKDEAVDEVARQFEGLFVQMMVKHMRAASLGEGLLDSQQSLFYRDLYDQELAAHLAEARGIGLADVIRRQLGGMADAAAPPAAGRDPEAYFAAPIERARPVEEARAPSETRPVNEPLPAGSPETFVRRLWPAAERASAELGTRPEALLAQAALETGWGKHVMRHQDGTSSHNLFGIKADRRWDGERVTKTTLEYRDGVAVKTRADFRAYGSFEESFADYVDFLKTNPRYRQALAVAPDAEAYLSELQAAGYATDPGYAEKIARILNGEAMTAARQGLKATGSVSL